MKHILRLLALATACIVLGFHAEATQAAPSANGSSKTQLEFCGAPDENYLFALCAATTCSDTGKRIAVNTPRGGKRWFKEVKCTCPVVNTNSSNAGLTDDLAQAYTSGLPAIANVTGGNMRGNCAYPDSAAGPSGGIWSLYSTVAEFPQLTTLNGTTWNMNSPATLNHCSKNLNQGREFANCFSFKCGAPYVSNGVLVSDCSCPKGEDVLSALPAPPAMGFFTNAGGNAANQDEKDAYCRAHPVGGF